MRHFFTHNISLKVIAVGLAIIVWTYVKILR